MATSLELRSPLLDHEVLELGVSSARLAALRGPAREGRPAACVRVDLIPAELATRGKTGFGIPLGDWFRGPLRELAGDTLLDARARARGQLQPRRRRAHARTSTRAASATTAIASGACSCSSSGSARGSTPPSCRASRCGRTDDPRARHSQSCSPPRCVPRLVVLALGAGAILEELVEKSDRFAQTLVASGTFGFLPGRPSGYTQPLYAWFLAGLYQVFERHWLVVGIAHIAIAALTAVIVLEIGRRAVSPRVGVVGATHRNAAPVPRLARHAPEPGGPGRVAHRARGAPRARRRGAEGRTAGARSRRRSGSRDPRKRPARARCRLSSRRSSPFRSSARDAPCCSAAAVLAGAVVVVAPWIARNEVSVGCPVLTTDTRALWKANNENTREMLDAAAGSTTSPSPAAARPGRSSPPTSRSRAGPPRSTSAHSSATTASSCSTSGARTRTRKGVSRLRPC